LSSDRFLGTLKDPTIGEVEGESEFSEGYVGVLLHQFFEIDGRGFVDYFVGSRRDRVFILDFLRHNSLLSNMMVGHHPIYGMGFLIGYPSKPM
jgi:hypothetical protein